MPQDPIKKPTHESGQHRRTPTPPTSSPRKNSPSPGHPTRSYGNADRPTTTSNKSGRATYGATKSEDPAPTTAQGSASGNTQLPATIDTDRPQVARTGGAQQPRQTKMQIGHRRPEQTPPRSTPAHQARRRPPFLPRICNTRLV